MGMMDGHGHDHGVWRKKETGKRYVSLTWRRKRRMKKKYYDLDQGEVRANGNGAVDEQTWMNMLGGDCVAVVAVAAESVLVGMMVEQSVVKK
jgi:hypothetical protein